MPKTAPKPQLTAVILKSGVGASPCASTSAFIALEVLEKCFEKELAGGWRDRLKTIIPTYGIDLIQDAAATRDIRAQTAAVLGLANV